MIFPVQTSLMPIQIALARFLEQGGNILGNYPYWYLGTTPYRYLTGPVLPSILVFLHQIFSGLSLFEIFLGLISLVFPFGAVGTYLLVKELKGSRSQAVLAAVFYFFGILVPLLFRFSNGLSLITFSLLPFILVLYLQLLKKWSLKTVIVLCSSITLVILLETLIIPTLILGMSAIFLTQVGWKKAEKKLKRTLLVVSCSLLVATFWYSPGYWFTLLGAPSLAGKGLASVIVWLLKLLPTVLAFGIAVFSVKLFKKKNLLRDFCFYWLFIFGFLTLLRFLSDPDFWMDWTAYGAELQMGGAIAMALILTKLSSKLRLSAIRLALYAIMVTFYLLTFTFIFNKYVIATLQRDISSTVEYKIGKQLSKTAKPEERVFLSGTSAFWLNAFFDIPQVRGGVDQASTDPRWREATWEIRDGSASFDRTQDKGSPQEAKKSVEWLKKLGIKYLVVHTKESEEFYHDFVYPEKFEGVKGLEKIYDESGDRIYKVSD